jgi:hypothetical protein
MDIKKSDFGVIQLPEVKGKKKKKSQIRICGFHCVAKPIEGWLNICTLFLARSHIWLNLHREDC